MSDSISVLVVDDSALMRNLVSRIVEATPGLSVADKAMNGIFALQKIPRCNPDVIILDIEMPGATGLEVAQELPKTLPVGFVTAHAEHAVRAFETAAFDFLVKPATAGRIEIALARIRERRAGPVSVPRPAGSLRFPVRAGEGLVFMDLARTSHFLVEDEVVWAFVAGERLRTPWKSLTEAESSFPQGVLVKGHRNMLVRPEAIVGVKVGEYGRLLVRLQGGLSVEVSRGAAPGLKARLGLA